MLLCFCAALEREREGRYFEMSRAETEFIG